MLTGNKGEWSEIYTLIKLLGEKVLFSGDADLNKIDDLFYPIVKIIRNESIATKEYELSGDIVIVSGGAETIRIPVTVFQAAAVTLLDRIKHATGVFRIREFEDFLSQLNCTTLKAKSTRKTDIQIVIHDRRLNQKVDLGFSIKSQLGGDSTLLNAGRTTNFIYQILNFSPNVSQVSEINNIATKSKIKDRIEAIKRQGGTLKYTSLEQDVFKNNLILIDSLLPDIIAEIVQAFYSTNLNSISELSNFVTRKNPINYDNRFSHKFYEYKIKRFLTDVALGMMPSKVWGGVYDATGGYLIVKENGDVLCYHLYNRNQFEDYLFKNTKLETASSTRHGFGQIYTQNNQWLFKLNLQIRFTS